MKRVIELAVVSIVALGLAGVAQADMYTETHDPADIFLAASGPGHVASTSHTFDITLQGFPHGIETVISANLSVWVYDDGDNWGTNNRESFDVTYDGTVWTALNNVELADTLSAFSTSVDTSMLQSDGKLLVTITATKGDFYYDKSTLTVVTERVPLPGAVLLGFLGLSAAGRKLRRFV
jgi:hypothetical protein